jgi:hypothetical protein
MMTVAAAHLDVATDALYGDEQFVQGLRVLPPPLRLCCSRPTSRGVVLDVANLAEGTMPSRGLTTARGSSWVNMDVVVDLEPGHLLRVERDTS